MQPGKQAKGHQAEDGKQQDGSAETLRGAEEGGRGWHRYKKLHYVHSVNIRTFAMPVDWPTRHKPDHLGHKQGSAVNHVVSLSLSFFF